MNAMMKSIDVQAEQTMLAAHLAEAEEMGQRTFIW